MAIGNPDISDLNFAELTVEGENDDTVSEQDSESDNGEDIELFRKFIIKVNL